MRHFFTILSHEIRMLLVNPGTYIAAVLFLTVMGLIFTKTLEDFSTPQEDSPTRVFFEYFPIPVLFMVPLLTMKSISEERRQGTLETLLTTPVSTVEVVLGKFGAAYFLYLLLWASTGGFFFILNKFAVENRFIELGPLFGGYLFIAVSGLFFIAIGILASSLARNQAVAGILSMSALFVLIFGLYWLGEKLALLDSNVLHPLKAAVDYTQVFQHLSDFSRGIIDTRQLLFYFSGTVLTLIFSIFSVEARLLHS